MYALVKNIECTRRSVLHFHICKNDVTEHVVDQAYTRSSYLTERDEESAEVTRGVAADRILKALPVLCKAGAAFRGNTFICIIFTCNLDARLQQRNRTVALTMAYS